MNRFDDTSHITSNKIQPFVYDAPQPIFGLITSWSRTWVRSPSAIFPIFFSNAEHGLFAGGSLPAARRAFCSSSFNLKGCTMLAEPQLDRKMARKRYYKPSKSPFNIPYSIDPKLKDKLIYQSILPALVHRLKLKKNYAIKFFWVKKKIYPMKFSPLQSMHQCCQRQSKKKMEVGININRQNLVFQDVCCKSEFRSWFDSRKRYMILSDISPEWPQSVSIRY